MDLSLPKHFDFLKNVSIFRELTEKQLFLVIKHLKTKEVKVFRKHGILKIFQ